MTTCKKFINNAFDNRIQESGENIVKTEGKKIMIAGSSSLAISTPDNKTTFDRVLGKLLKFKVYWKFKILLLLEGVLSKKIQRIKIF